VATGKRKIKSAKNKPAARKARVKSKAVKPARKRPAGSVPSVKAGGLSGKLRAAALKVLEDRQAEEIVMIDLINRSSVADYLIIASGRAGRQIAAIADYLREAFMKLGVSAVRVEGLSQANWVLVDAGDVVVHLFRPEVRHYYRLEDLWNSNGEDIKTASFMIE